MRININIYRDIAKLIAIDIPIILTITYYGEIYTRKNKKVLHKLYARLYMRCVETSVCIVYKGYKC